MVILFLSNHQYWAISALRKTNLYLCFNFAFLKRRESNQEIFIELEYIEMTTHTHAHIRFFLLGQYHYPDSKKIKAFVESTETEHSIGLEVGWS